MEEKRRATSDLLERVVDHHNGDTITVGEIKNSLHERGFGVLMAIASLPLCIPVPVPPGYTTFFSIPLFILAVEMIWGLDSPWFPKWVNEKRMKRKTLAKVVEKGVPLLRKIEKLLKPRMNYLPTDTWEKIIGIFAFIFSMSIAVPLPLTNLPPGYGILIMSLGLLSKDGLTIVIGIVIGVIGVGITSLILMFGAEAVYGLFSSSPVEPVAPFVIVPSE